MDFLESAEEFGQTPERLVGVYGVLKPHLVGTYEDHLNRTNPVYEPPTRRILLRVTDEERRHVAAGRVVLAHLVTELAVEERVQDWQRRLEALLRDAGGVLGGLTEFPTIPDVPPDPTGIAQDLVQLERPLGRWPVPPELEAAVEAHALHLRERNFAALERDLASGDRGAGMAVYRSLAPFECSGHRIVGFAKLGGQCLIKLRLEGSGGAAVVNLRWGKSGEQWLVLETEVVRAEPSLARTPDV
jgi:hypothetical protein